MSRYSAAFLHLLISFAVFVGLAYLVLFIWYPDFFYTIDGGWEGMRIIIFVDLVLGPCLTLVVYKAGKPGLKFDLTSIALLQTVCLAAGLYVVYSERPTFFVFYEGHFYSASKDTFERYGQVAPDPNNFGGETPVKVIAIVPSNPIEEADFRKILYQDGIPVWAYEKSYAPLSEHMDAILSRAFDQKELIARDEQQLLEPWLAKHGGELSDYSFFPIHSRYQSPFVAIRNSDQEFVDVVLIPAPLGI